MPWRECHKMDERLRFVARLLDGEKMAVLCREFDISRKTGYKIFTRYKDCGIEGLTDRSRRPYRHARQLPFQIEKAIIQLKSEHPSWGAPKIRERLRRKHSDIHCPAISTVHAILDRHGLVKRRRRRLYKAEGTALSRPYVPNDLWCAELESLHEWLHKTATTLSKKSELAKAIRYALSNWVALTRYRDDGRLEADNNAAERALRAVALGRKNWLFAGSDDGGERAAAIYTLIGTAKLNELDPEGYLRHVLERIAGHPINKIEELLPWNVAARIPELRLAA
jgi:transposase